CQCVNFLVLLIEIPPASWSVWLIPRLLGGRLLAGITMEPETTVTSSIDGFGCSGRLDQVCLAEFRRLGLRHGILCRGVGLRNGRAGHGTYTCSGGGACHRNSGGGFSTGIDCLVALIPGLLACTSDVLSIVEQHGQPNEQDDDEHPERDKRTDGRTLGAA